MDQVNVLKAYWYKFQLSILNNNGVIEPSRKQQVVQKKDLNWDKYSKI